PEWFQAPVLGVPDGDDETADQATLIDQLARHPVLDHLPGDVSDRVRSVTQRAALVNQVLRAKRREDFNAAVGELAAVYGRYSADQRLAVAAALAPSLVDLKRAGRSATLLSRFPELRDSYLQDLDAS